MSLLRLAATNLLRNPLRSSLTVAGVAIAVVTFLLLRTVIWSYNVAAEQAVPDRVVTRHKVTFIMTLPKRYIEDVRATDGVRAATWANWWGGKEPNHPNEFFATLAVDPESFLEVYDELQIPPADLEGWKQDRQGVIVGDLLAQKFGWTVGDTVSLESGIFVGAQQFHISGIYLSTRKTFDRQTFLFHWDYLNEMMPEGQREQIGWITSRTEGNPSDVGRAIDRVFDERDVQTVSQDEATFQRSFLAGFSAILTAINVISFLILGIMTLILGNTVAMGVRERTSEYGVLRAIGFMPKHVVVLVLGEALALGLVGGMAGLAVAYPVVELGIGRFVEENMSGFFPYFRISGGNAVAAIVLAIALAMASAAMPALQASRLKVIEALRRVA
jgi:putative ABC transport system permease protein